MKKWVRITFEAFLIFCLIALMAKTDKWIIDGMKGAILAISMNLFLFLNWTEK